MVHGFIHSIETYGALDGPGIRYVAFLQGCPLRCKYCHNPDTWKLYGGKEYTVDELMTDIMKYKNYIKKGGVTLTGGEPLLQAEFVAEVFRQCKKRGIHTAIDTSGAIPLGRCKEAIDLVDLVLLDIKSINDEKCKSLTGKGNNTAKALLEYLQSIGTDVWIRHVVVPGITEDYDEIDEMGRYLAQFDVIKKVEILPFHKMGEFKWEELGIKYELNDTMEPSKESITKIKEILKGHGLNVGG